MESPTVEWARIRNQIEQEWNSRKGLNEDERQRGKGSACLEEGKRWLMGRLGERELQMALFAFINAEEYYRYGTLIKSSRCVPGSEDDLAESYYQRGWVLEKATELGFVNEGYFGAGHQYAQAVRDAKSRKANYEAEFRDFLKRRESLIPANVRDNLIRESRF